MAFELLKGLLPRARAATLFSTVFSEGLIKIVKLLLECAVFLSNKLKTELPLEMLFNQKGFADAPPAVERQKLRFLAL